MTAFEDRNTATVLRQITKYGKTVTLQRAGTKTYDPATQANTGVDPASETFKALVKDFDGDSALGLLLESGDKMFLIPAKNRAKPTIADKITVDTDVYMIVPVVNKGGGVQTQLVGEVAAFYRVHGRQS
jgi:hypothetical protein